MIREGETEAEGGGRGGRVCLEREARGPKGPRKGKARGLDTAWSRG